MRKLPLVPVTRNSWQQSKRLIACRLKMKLSYETSFGSFVYAKTTPDYKERIK